MNTPFSVIGGFLGAGKTSFINKLLADPQGVRYGVLVNDFGSLAVDAGLLSGDDRDVLSLANGCACCSLGSDLATGINKLQSLGMEHIVLECSGVAIPSRIGALAKLAPNLVPHATITLINGHTLADLLVDQWMADTYVKQLQGGGQLLLNRTDTADLSDLAQGQQTLSHAGIDKPVALQTLHSTQQWLTRPVGSDQVEGHSVSQLATQTVIAKDLSQAKQWAAQAAADAQIYRMKGFVQHGAARMLIQVVGKDVSITVAPEGVTELGLVVIGTAKAVAQF